MSKRNPVRSNKRTTPPARLKQQIKRKEAQKRAKYPQKMYYRQMVHSRPRGM